MFIPHPKTAMSAERIDVLLRTLAIHSQMPSVRGDITTLMMLLRHEGVQLSLTNWFEADWISDNGGLIAKGH
jgi:hypothetical protein